jgi:hypothetical protein
MSSTAPQSPGAVRAKLEFPVWYRGFAKSYNSWANAPSDLKAPLLLQGAALAKAESWFLACPDKLTESQKRFIVRSISHRAREPASGQAAPARRPRQSTWRRATDRNLWQLYAVIAVGMWVFAPEMIRDLMERALNPPEVHHSIPHPQIARAPQLPNVPDGITAEEDGMPSAIVSDGEPAATAPSGGMAPDGDIDETPPLTFPPRPPLSRAMRLADLAREQLEAGHGRLARLIAIEAGEGALAESTAEPKAAEAAAAVLARTLATREPLGALAARSATARASLFCHEGQGLVAITSEESIGLWFADTPRRSAALPLELSTLEGAATDRDCRRIALPDADHNLVVRTIGSGVAPLQLVGHEATILATSFSRDGTTVVTASQDGTARVWDTRTGRQRALLSGHDWHVVGAELSADGSIALTASSDNTARLWNAASGRQLHVLRGHQGIVTSARFVHGGRRVLTTSWDGTARLWDAQTGASLRVLQHASGILLAEASPDGRHFGTSDTTGRLTIWDERDEPARIIDGTGPEESIRALRFFPDGSRLAVLTWSGRVTVHNGETGAELSVLTSQAQRVREIAVGPAGRSLAAITERGERLTWPVIASPADALIQAKAASFDCLSTDERASLGIDGEPPSWCATLKPRAAMVR